jgi:perosamine synthetase
MSEKLACLGGPKLINFELPRYNPFGQEEVDAAVSVVKTGMLSDYIGAWCPKFYGGEHVQALEAVFKETFSVKHAISVNSLTSGLICAVGALDIEPGDEVIVSPWTMCATATAIIMWNAIPVFADIERGSFNIDPASIEKNISERTKAIMVPSIFGSPARLNEIKDIAAKHHLKVIEDAAQAPGVRYHDTWVGTVGDIGGFSLNCHKHIHTGEGGVMVTNDDDLAERMRLIRNHAEAVVVDKEVSSLSNMLGFNFRLGEVEAAIGVAQMKKLDDFVDERYRHAQIMNEALRDLPGLTLPVPEKDCGHAYYVYGMSLDILALGVERSVIANALRAEGVEGITEAYVNVHRYPMYVNKIAYGSKGMPWKIGDWESPVKYGDGVCPTAENLNDETYLGFVWCQHRYTDEQIIQVSEAFKKVWLQLESLKA